MLIRSGPILEKEGRRFVRDNPHLRELWTLNEVREALDIDFSISEKVALGMRPTRYSLERLFELVNRYHWKNIPFDEVAGRKYWVAVFKALRALEENRLSKRRKYTYDKQETPA